MNVFFDELKFPTSKEFEMVNITDRVRDSVAKSGIMDGMVLVFSPHTTGLVRISESEVSLMADYRKFFDMLAPKAGDYGHNRTNVDDRPNAHAHLQSMLVNSGEAIPLREGKLLLGTWQTIFFVELDGARPERKVTIEVLGR
ncbi:MAG: secondary thiamine-phosphate synthase enzyme YjbQ [Candidatus Marsarchaeota archaeon]|jgi:secondary thiamine-phosphate synthase enzyme|nr:secondary thiamine-phosphate synthase enzyme YjbQ [Candidatus Marsarchaeota archaeon]